MWRSIRRAEFKTEVSSHIKRSLRPYSNSTSTGSNNSKIVISAVAVTSAAATGAVIYGKYDPKFRNLLETNIPYVKHVYKYLGEDSLAIKVSKPSADKSKESAISSGLLKKKIDRTQENLSSSNSKTENESKIKESPVLVSEKEANIENNIKNPELNTNIQSNTETEIANTSNALKEKEIYILLDKLQKSSEKSQAAYNEAIECIKKHTQTLYDALDIPESDNEMLWKEAEVASNNKNKCIKIAEEQARHTKNFIEELKFSTLTLDSSSLLLQKCEESTKTVEEQLRIANNKIISLKKESDVAVNYEKLVTKSKEQFRKELNIILPNYIHGDRDLSDEDLNLLLAHAHRRIEQLQKQLARQQVEKISADEALKELKIQGKKVYEHEQQDFENAITKRVAHMKENFEAELRQQLRRQAAAHSDHLQEVTKIQEQELERKYSLQLEEKLLHQKGVFISEVSGNIARLKGISAYLKAKAEFDTVSKKAQALWLACQAMSHKTTMKSSSQLHPLGTDIAAVKIAADEDNEFIMSVLASIPNEAVNRGVYTNDDLKERFQDVKRVCRKVAIVDENNNSLFRYFLSYIQSFLIIDNETVPKAEIDNKIAVDPSEWDNFDILARISYSLKINDLEQAIRYANQLKGECKVVSQDWIKETQLLLETQLAVKALLAHAAAIGVQAYH